MKLTGSIVSLFAAAVMCAGVKADDKIEATDKPSLPPELKVFQRWIGSWSYESTICKSEWTPEEKHAAGKFTCAWTMGGRYLEERGTDGEDGSHMRLTTFDATRQAYRAWWFSSTGISNESTGSWDDAAKTFSWTAKIENGRTVASRQHFVSDDVVEASVRVTDSTGKEFFHAEYKSTRQAVR